MIPFAAEIIDHARRELPNECCGLIACEGSGYVEGSIPVQIIAVPNADASPSSYRMDPGDLMDAFTVLDDNDWDLWAIYHSHPRTPAELSEADRRAAVYPVRYIVCSLADLSWPILRAFRIEDGEVVDA